MHWRKKVGGSTAKKVRLISISFGMGVNIMLQVTDGASSVHGSAPIKVRLIWNLLRLNFGDINTSK